MRVVRIPISKSPCPIARKKRNIKLDWARIAPAVFTAGLVALMISCSDEPQRPPSARDDFWTRFVNANTAWLDPPAREMSYDAIVQGKKYAPDVDAYEWSDEVRIETWCAPKENARFLSWSTRGEEPGRISEHRFAEGRGGRVTIPPSREGRRLTDAEWITARCGTTFLCSLHFFAWWGLPNTFSVEQQQDRWVIQVHNLYSDFGWRKRHGSYPVYGVHEFAETVRVDRRVGGLNYVEVQIDSRSLLPIKLVERDLHGLETSVEFAQPWLEIEGRRVPSQVTVRWTEQDDKCSLVYEFQVREGTWLLKSAELTGPHESLSLRVRLEGLRIGAVANSLFMMPTDVDLPERSYTELAEGERIITFTTRDGLTLEGKLSLPRGADNPVPVVMLLPGAGPWTFDRPVEYPAPGNHPLLADTQFTRCCDFYASELTKRGIGFFRTNKRGCAIAKEKPYERVNREVFSKTTPSVLVEDYAAALKELRRQADVDASRIVLLGTSEGTRLAPRLALREPQGIVAIVMCGYAEDDFEDIINWQMSVGSWRNVARLLDANGDDVITAAEFHTAPQKQRRFVLGHAQFEAFDDDADGRITPDDLAALNEPHLQATLAAVRERNDDFLWEHLLNLSSAYLDEEWHREPTHRTLLQLDIPLAIFHGEHDGSCRAEGVRKAEEAFRRAGRDNLIVRLYPRTGHDLNFEEFLIEGRTPQPFVDMFDYIGDVVTQSGPAAP